jgi:hypothetical protein
MIVQEIYNVLAIMGSSIEGLLLQYVTVLYALLLDIYANIIHSLVEKALADILISADKDFKIQCDTFTEVKVNNINLLLDFIPDIPVTLSNCTLGKLSVDFTSIYNVEIHVSHLYVTANVCNLPKTSGQPQEKVEHVEQLENDEDALMGLHELALIIADFVENVFEGTRVTLMDTEITFVTKLGVSADVYTHEMKMNIARTAFHTQKVPRLDITGARVSACPPLETAYIPQIGMRLLEDGQVLIDCGQSTDEFIENAKISLCGDSYFILSFFAQLLMENQRYISKQNVRVESVGSPDTIHESVLREMLQESMQDITHAAGQEHNHHVRDLLHHKSRHRRTLDKEKDSRVVRKIKSMKGSSWVKALKVENINFIIDFFRGSDLEKTRVHGEKITAKCAGAQLFCDFEHDQLHLSVESIQTTIGYIEEPIYLSMVNVYGNYWDANISIPEVFVRTSQHIVASMMVILNFNVVWNDYDILYHSSETIRFRHVTIDEIYFQSKFYSSPVDVRKVMKGHWKQLLKLIPPCDFAITLPRTILRYQVGWEEVLDHYIEEMVSSQKIRCVKKVVFGVAKRKVRQIFSSS